MDAKALSSLLCTLVTAGSGRSSAPRWDEQPSGSAPRRPQQKRPSTRRPPNRSRSFKEPGSSYRSFDSSPSSSTSTATSSFTSSFFTTTTTHHHTINIKNETVTHHNTSLSDEVDNLKSDDSFDLPMHSGFEKECEPESRRSASFDEYDREPELSPHRYSSFSSSFPGFSTRPLPSGGELYTGSSTPSPSSSCSSSPSSSAVELSQFVPAESLMRLLSSPLGPPPEHDAASSCCEDEKGGLTAGTGWVLWYDTSERKEAGLSKSSFLRKLRQYPAPIHTFRDFSLAVLYLLLGTSQKAGGASSPFSLSAQRLPGFMDEQENEHMIEQQLWDLETKLCLLSKEEEESGEHAEAHEEREKRKDKDSKDSKDETNGDCRKPSAGLGFGVVGMREVGLHLFRAGVAPVWEDRANRSGGSWLLSFPSYLPALRSALATIAALFSGQLDSSGICGIVVTSKPKKGGKVSLWTGNRENTKCARFSQISHLVHPLCTSMFFRPHALRLYPPSSPTKPKKQKSKKSGNTKKRGKAKKSLNMGDAVAAAAAAAAASAADTSTITTSDPNAPPASEKTPTKSRRRKGGAKSKAKKEEQEALLTEEPLYAPGAPPSAASAAVVTTSAEAVSCVDAATSDSMSAGLGFHLPADLMELCAPVMSSTSPSTSTDSKPSELCPVFFSPRSSSTLPVSDVSSIHLEPVACTPAPVEKVESSPPPIPVPLPTPTSEVGASQAVVAQPLGLVEPCVHAPPKAARPPMYALPILYVFLLMALLVLLITFFVY